MAPEAKGTNEASRKAENPLTGHTNAVTSSRPAAITRLGLPPLAGSPPFAGFLPLHGLPPSCPSLARCPSRAPRGLLAVRVLQAPRRLAALHVLSSLFRAVCSLFSNSLFCFERLAPVFSNSLAPFRAVLFLILKFFSVPRVVCSLKFPSPLAVCFFVSISLMSYKRFAPVLSLSSGSLLCFKFRSLFQAVCSLFLKLLSPFGAVCSLLSNFLVSFAWFAPCSQILQSLWGGLLHA